MAIYKKVGLTESAPLNGQRIGPRNLNAVQRRINDGPRAKNFAVLQLKIRAAESAEEQDKLRKKIVDPTAVAKQQPSDAEEAKAHLHETREKQVAAAKDAWKAGQKAELKKVDGRATEAFKVRVYNDTINDLRRQGSGNSATAAASTNSGAMPSQQQGHSDITAEIEDELVMKRAAAKAQERATEAWKNNQEIQL